MNYSDLSQETQLYLNKAMDIYSTIKDKNITKKVKNVFDTIRHDYTKLDKKVLSLFIAGFLVDGNLKNILSEYDDIKLHDLLDFIGIEEKDIKPLEAEEYEEFYNSNLRLDIISMIKERTWGGNINFITPEVILRSLQYGGLKGSQILDHYAKTYEISDTFLGFSDHPLFKVLENYTIIDGSIEDRRFWRKNNQNIPSGLFSPESHPSKERSLKLQPETRTQKQGKTTIFDDNIWQLLDDIKKKFIGQEDATEDLFYNIVNNQQLAEIEDIPDGQRAIIFLDGSTGTGKTAITREITEKLGIPFTATSLTNYSSTGYVGGNITDVLKELYIEAAGDLEKAQKGIIVFDEFDKLASSGKNALEMKRAVQQQLLDFLGGGKYTISIHDRMFDREIQFDTSKLTFICLGALTDLRSKKANRQATIGFTQVNQSDEEQGYSITPEDLISIGLERELVGRFNTYLHTEDYSKEALERILRESTISPLSGFKKWIESHGKQFTMDDDVYTIIAEQAYELNTGARSLQTIMNNIRTKYIKEVLRGTSDTIHLDSETVIQTNNQTVHRRGRA